MKKLVLFLSFIFLNIFSFGQANNLKVELLSDKETFNKNENLVLSVKLTNLGLTSIYIPDTFNVSSNICANGLENLVTGGNIHFNLQPISNWCSLVLEDIVMVPVENYLELKPNSNYIFKYNFGKHINEMYPPACDTFGIKLNEKYTIQAEYTSGDTIMHKDKVIFTGTVKSNLIELKIK